MSQRVIIGPDEDGLSVIGGYMDLGQIMNAGAVAAGAQVFSPVYSNLQWVRGWIALGQVDQAWSFYVFRAGTDGVFDWGTGFTGLASSGTSNWATVESTMSANSPNAALVGYSAKFALTNNGSSPTTVAKIKMQLFGL